MTLADRGRSITSTDLAGAFEEFRSSEIERFRVKVRRVRAKQLRELLRDPETLTLDIFNREVWQLDSGASVGGEPMSVSRLFSEELTVDEARSLNAALDAGQLELHGNCIWGSGTRVYGAPMRERPEEKLELVKEAVRLLSESSLAPMEKATRIEGIKGFGRNIATGLVMVFHPDDFAIYNEVSQQAYTDLGFDASMLEQFERSARELQDTLGADDFLELDWFLYPRGGVAASERVEAVDRSSADSALRVFNTQVPVAARAGIAELFVDLIEAADRKRPGGWTVNLFPDRWQFNVGSTQVAWLWRQQVGLAFDSAVLTEEQLAEVNAAGDPRSRPGSYLAVPTLTDAHFQPDTLGAVLPLVRPALLAGIEKLAAKFARSPHARAYSPGIIDALEQMTGRQLPRLAAEAADDSGTTGDVQRVDVLHLVAKWSAQHGPDTVQRHQEVAAAHGQVWWGVIGSPDKRKLSDENFARLQTQLQGGLETFVFLAGPRTAPVFRTRLVDLALERPAMEDLIPSYYPSKIHHSLWLKLEGYDQLDHAELLRQLEPNAAPGRLVTLTNQTNPLLVRVRSVPRVWWVNQGSSFKRGRQSGCLWAPMTDKAGRGHDHWESLEYAKPGDLVINYADGQIRAVSTVKALAYPATRPDPAADQEWSNEGRRLDVEYRDLETLLPLSSIPEGRRQGEGGPFDKGGGVRQGYFFPLSDSFANTLRGLSPELAALLPKGEASTITTIAGTDYIEPAFEDILNAVLAQGMALSQRTIRRYHLSLKSRGFVVLSGVSGTGKTWLAQAYAKAVAAEYRVIPVAPNWTTNEDLLGYMSPLSPDYRDTPFSRFLRSASAEWQAAKNQNRRARPYHVILDEMNLARVEYYFAQFLSVMELRARDGEADIELAPGDTVTVGPNLLFVGTVNIDETTHLFADKVFDRAQLVELDIDRAALEAHLGDPPHKEVLLALWDVLQDVAPFAYRVVDEIGVYLGQADQLGVDWKEALDEQIFQKLLPKLKGADPRVGGALERFIEVTGTDFPLSRHKAETMLEGFVQHGFSSYF